MKEIIAMLLVFMILLRGCGGVEHSEEEQKNELQSEQKNELEKEYDLGFYYKDGEIFSVDLNNVEPKRLSEDFADEDTGSEFDRWPFIHYVGNRVFFSDKGSDRSYKQGKDRSENIYYRDLADPDAKNILIDNDILVFYFSEKNFSRDGAFVTYQKAGDHSLYQWHEGKVEIIAENLPEHEFYDVSEDGKRIVFYDMDRNLYYKEFGKEKELIDQNIQYENFMCGDSSIDPRNILLIEATDPSVIVYQKEENGKIYLYQKTLGSPSVRLGESLEETCFNLINIGSDHYFQIKGREFPLGDFIEDDLKEGVHPMRERSKDADERNFVKTHRFWYFDGKGFELLDGEFFQWVSEGDSRYGNFPTTLFYEYPEKRIEKVKLSEYSDIMDLSRAVHKRLAENTKKYFPVRGKLLEIEPSDCKPELDRENKFMRYYVPTGDRQGDLYQREINGDQVGEPQKVLSNIDMDTIFITNNEKIIAYVTSRGGIKALFVDGEMIDKKVSGFGLLYDEKDQAIYYDAKDEHDQELDIMKVYRNGETKEIARSVWNKDLLPSGKLMYITDWEENKGGKLYFYDGEKSILIDEGVYGILSKHPLFW